MLCGLAVIVIAVQRIHGRADFMQAGLSEELTMTNSAHNRQTIQQLQNILANKADNFKRGCSFIMACAAEVCIALAAILVLVDLIFIKGQTLEEFHQDLLKNTYMLTEHDKNDNETEKTVCV